MTHYVPLRCRVVFLEMGFQLDPLVELQVHREAAVQRIDEPSRDESYQLEACWLHAGSNAKVNLLPLLNNTEQELLLTRAIKEIKQKHLDALIARNERNSEYGD